MLFLAEIGKKSYLLSAVSVDKADQLLLSYHKDKTIKISEAKLQEPLKFKIGTSSIATSTKIKDTVISFITDSNMSGKIDISLLPVEVAKALP